MVIGELACGNLPERADFLRRLKRLPVLPRVAADDLLALMETHAWTGKGIGYVDANLLGAVFVDGSATLWTNDLRLRRLADQHGVAHIPAAEDD